MKKLAILLLFINTARAVTCPSDYVEISDDNYRVVGGDESCGAGWTEIIDSNILPFLFAGVDDGGSYSETICAVR